MVVCVLISEGVTCLGLHFRDNFVRERGPSLELDTVFLLSRLSAGFSERAEAENRAHVTKRSHQQEKATPESLELQ